MGGFFLAGDHSNSEPRWPPVGEKGLFTCCAIFLGGGMLPSNVMMLHLEEQNEEHYNTSRIFYYLHQVI